MRYGWTVGAALMALAGCGKSGTSPQAAGPGNVVVNGTPADITISTPNGTAEIHAGGGTAPAGLAEGIPAYPNADAGQTIDINGGSAQGHGRVLGFGTHDAPAQVIDFYARAVGAAGYTIANQMSMGATASLTARRGSQAVNIVATSVGGGTRVQIMVGANAP